MKYEVWIAHLVDEYDTRIKDQVVSRGEVETEIGAARRMRHWFTAADFDAGWAICGSVIGPTSVGPKRLFFWTYRRTDGTSEGA